MVSIVMAVAVVILVEIRCPVDRIPSVDRVGSGPDAGRVESRGPRVRRIF